jgi:oxygen-dependent protoporphyrinogen oxidase
MAAAAETGVDLEVTVLEAEPRLGGKVRTERIDGVPLEWGPDSFLSSKPRGRELADELGLWPDLVGTGPQAGRVYLLLGGRLRLLPRGLAMGIPAGVRPLAAAVRSGVLGPASAVRAALEPMVGRRAAAQGATVGEVAAARLGRKAAERLVDPLVQGVFGAPALEVGLAEALPWAAGHRSLIRAAAHRPAGEAPSFLSIRGGMDRLIERLAAALADVRSGTPATAVSISGRAMRVKTGGRSVKADAVLLAVPAPDAADLLESSVPDAARALSGITYSSSAVVLLRFPEGSLGRRMDGSGYLVASGEGGVVAACSWVSSKWPHLAGGTWLRAVVTGSGALSLTDDVLKHRVAAEVAATMGAHRPPDRILMTRWPQALPVYRPGHADRVRAARGALPDTVALAGAYLEGVGLPDCIRTGESSARDLVRALASA